MQRLRFFDGQFLTAKDFQAEQDYHREKRQLHNRLLHGFGIVKGLTVSVDPATGSGMLVVSVSPGLAIDAKGNEILLESPIRVDFGICTSDTCFITLDYTETPTDPVPVANGAVEFSRITEGSVVRIASEDPSDCTNAPLLCLARLIRLEGRWVVDDTYSRPAIS